MSSYSSSVFEEFYRNKEDPKFYICEKCKSIPQIKINKELTVEVKCSYCKRNNNKNQELMSLEAFVDYFTKNQESLYCSMTSEHMNAKAAVYCQTCKRNYCLSCLDKHNSFVGEHPTINLKKKEVNFSCENKECTNNEKVEFYCVDCEMHLCLTCKSQHLKPHKIIELKNMYNEAIIFAYSEYINKVVNSITKETEIYENFILNLEKSVQNLQNLLIYKRTKDEYFINFINSLLTTYHSNKRIFNYNIINNIMNNDIFDVWNDKTNKFYEKAISEFNYFQYLTMSLTEIRETLNNNKNTFEKFIENINQQSIINGIVQLKQKMKNNHNNEAIYSLLITKNNKLVSGGNDNKICVFNYDENSGKYAFDYCLTGHIKCVNSLCELLSKENHILSGSGDNTIKAWDLLIKQCVKTFYGHEGSVLKVIILKNSLIASCSTDKTIKLWKESNAECFGTLVGHNGWVRSIVEIKRNTLVSAGDDKTLRLWNLEKLTEEYSFKNIYLSDINGMVYNENEDLLYVGDFEKKIKILDMKNLTLVKEIQIKNATGLGINSITRLLDGSFIICLSQQENQLRKYTKDFVFDSTIDYPYKSYISCSISMRNNQFVLSDWNGNISIWSY